MTTITDLTHVLARWLTVLCLTFAISCTSSKQTCAEGCDRGVFSWPRLLIGVVRPSGGDPNDDPCKDLVMSFYEDGEKTDVVGDQKLGADNRCALIGEEELPDNLLATTSVGVNPSTEPLHLEINYKGQHFGPFRFELGPANVCGQNVTYLIVRLDLAEKTEAIVEEPSYEDLCG